MAFRYMEDFDREKMLKYAKGELALQNKPVTEENIENKMKDLYYEWLASKVNDVVHKDDGIDDTFGLLDTLRKVPMECCIIIEQWMESKPIHYEGKYFNFEDAYNYVKIVMENENISLDIVEDFHSILKCIEYFNSYEKKIKQFSNLTKKEINEFIYDLKGSMINTIFIR